MSLLKRLIDLGTERGYWTARDCPLRGLSGIGESLEALDSAVQERNLLSPERWSELRSTLQPPPPEIRPFSEKRGEGTGRIALGRYQILERIGKGGGGEVYRGLDLELLRTVAVKKIEAGKDERFLREARATARLTHPNIVPVYDVGHDGEDCFLILEFIPGLNLREWLEERKRGWKEIARVLQQAVEGVAHAHANHILHRDLKPDNLLVDEQGKAFVTDFGLARETDSTTRLTLSGQIMGTPSFMSPEQAFGDSDRVDERSDLYSLGATLYFALTGVPPFQGTSMERILNKVRYQDPPSPHRLNPRVPVDLATISLKSLAKERHRRYASAREMADDLARFVNGEPVLAKPSSVLTRLFFRLRRHPLVASAALFVLLSSAGAAGLGLHAWKQKRAAEAERRAQEVRDRKRADAIPHVSAARRSLELAQVRWYREGEHGQALLLMDEAIAGAEHALSLDPDLAEAHLLIGRSLALRSLKDLNEGLMRRAEERFAKAARHAPDLIEIQVAWARLLVDHYFTRSWQMNVHVKDEPGARPTIELTVTEDPLKERAIELLTQVQAGGLPVEKTWSRAILCLLRGDYAESVEHFRELEPHLKSDTIGLTRFSLALVAAGRLEEAEAKATAAIEASRFFGDLFWRRALIRQALGRYAEAESDLTDAIDLDPNSVPFLFGRGTVRAVLEGKKAEGLADFRRVTELAPDDPIGWFAAGSTAMGLQRYDLAIADFSQFLEFPTVENTRFAWLNLGTARYSLGQYAEALNDWERALEMDPTLEALVREQRAHAKKQIGE